MTRDEIVGTRSEEALRRESEAASLRPLGEDNIGSKLLKGMGWREGQGVGRNGQGGLISVKILHFSRVLYLGRCVTQRHGSHSN